MIPYYIIEKNLVVCINIIGKSFEIYSLEILVRKGREFRQLIFFWIY